MNAGIRAGKIFVFVSLAPCITLGYTLSWAGGKFNSACAFIGIIVSMIVCQESLYNINNSTIYKDACDAEREEARQEASMKAEIARQRRLRPYKAVGTSIKRTRRAGQTLDAGGCSKKHRLGQQETVMQSELCQLH